MIGKHCSDIALSQQRRWLLCNWCHSDWKNRCWKKQSFTLSVQMYDLPTPTLKSDFLTLINDAVKEPDILSLGCRSLWVHNPERDSLLNFFLFLSFSIRQWPLSAPWLSLSLCAVWRNVKSRFGLGQDRRSVVEPGALHLVVSCPRHFQRLGLASRDLSFNPLLPQAASSLTACP